MIKGILALSASLLASVSVLAASPAPEQHCGYPQESDQSFVIVKDRLIKVVDVAPTSEMQALMDKSGHCTCLNAKLKPSETQFDYNFKEVYRDSIAQVKPNADCIKIQNETTDLDIKD